MQTLGLACAIPEDVRAEQQISVSPAKTKRKFGDVGVIESSEEVVDASSVKHEKGVTASIGQSSQTQVPESVPDSHGPRRSARISRSRAQSKASQDHQAQEIPRQVRPEARSLD